MVNYAQILNQLIEKQDLSFDQMKNAMQQVMTGAWTHAQIAGFLVALRIKHETVDEIAAAASVMRELSTKVEVEPSRYLIDTCGTGGDGIQTFNVSTTCAFVAAAAGAKVAKHGGRSVSSVSGSADALESLGVNVHQSPQQVAQCINQIGVGFMFAPNHHSAMKHAAPVRKELGIRTIFNMLGPLTNPAHAKNQLLGVFSASLTGRLAHVLKQLGSEHVMVVCGADGMDEISFTGDTHIAELKNGQVSEYIINPQQFGLAIHNVSSIKVANVDESKAMIMDVLTGKSGAARDIVLLNAGAAIYVAGLTDTLQSGIHLAAEMIDSGKALKKLQELAAQSQQ